MKAIINLAVTFLSEHWDEIDLKHVEIIDSKATFIKKVESNTQLAGWVVLEVMSWGCKTDYLHPYIVDNDESCTIKLGKKFYQSIGHHLFKEVKLKYKKVAYYE